MNEIIKTIKLYISTGSFITISALIYLFSDSSEIAKSIIEFALPANGKPLAFLTALGILFVYESHLRYKISCQAVYTSMLDKIDNMQGVLERGRLISDVNSAFTGFKTSGNEFITGKMYQKEIMMLEDKRVSLKVNSYTEAKLKFLISKIKYD